MPDAVARLDCGCYRPILTDDGVWITYSLDGSEISNVSPKSPRKMRQDLSEVEAQVEAETRYEPVLDDPQPSDDDDPPP